MASRPKLPLELRTQLSSLVARWRDDAQVLRRYGANGRARLLERLATELDHSLPGDAALMSAEIVAPAPLADFSRGNPQRRDAKEN
jgi:hypothetical protein